MSKIVVFILAGQSNMTGVGGMAELPPELRTPQTEIQYHYAVQADGLTWSESSGWTDLQHLAALSPQATYGPELSFGKTMGEAIRTPVAILKVSANNAGLAGRWSSYRNDLWPRLLERWAESRQQLVEQGYDPVVGGFVWVQGASDCANRADAESYGVNLVSLESSVWSDLGWEVDLVQSQQHIATDLPFVQAVRDAKSLYAPVFTDDLSLANGVLFDGASRIELGERLADAMIHARCDGNNDRAVDAVDLTGLLHEWGAGDGKYDVDANGTVGVEDLLMILTNWG